MRELILSLLFESRWSRLRHNLEDPRLLHGDSAGPRVEELMPESHGVSDQNFPIGSPRSLT